MHARRRVDTADIIPLQVDVKLFPSFETALRRFCKRVEKSGILDEYIRRLHYEKPSDKRRRKRAEQQRRRLRERSA